jgi:hypothetical protein
MSFFGLGKKNPASETKKPLVHRCEDGSILFEWLEREWRFVISIEKYFSESSWYLVTRKGKLDAYGYLSEDFLKIIKHETPCAVCGETKETPLRIDKMGGYICLKCADKKLNELL